MGCDIHSFVEVKKDGKWQLPEPPIFVHDKIGQMVYGETNHNHPFNWRSYGVFGFLADVRNYSMVPPIAERRGKPEDVSDYVKAEYWESDDHSHSWLSLKELLDFDYEAKFENRRITKQTGPHCWDGAALSEEGEGKVTAFREFLGKPFFNDLETMSKIGDPENVRIVFWFDN